MIVVATNAAFSVACPSGYTYVINIGGDVVALEIHGDRLFTVGQLVLAKDATLVRDGLPGIVSHIAVHFADRGTVSREATRAHRSNGASGSPRTWLKRLLAPGRSSDIIDVHFVGTSHPTQMKPKELRIPPVGSSVAITIEPAGG